MEGRGRFKMKKDNMFCSLSRIVEEYNRLGSPFTEQLKKYDRWHRFCHGGSAPVCMNASNEEAVLSFLRGEIKLVDIINITECMLERHIVNSNPTIEDIFETDREVRILTNEYIKTF